MLIDNSRKQNFDVTGIEKFLELYAKVPDVMQDLVKKWIQIGGRKEAMALVVLGQCANEAVLSDLFAPLSQELRGKCRHLLTVSSGDQHDMREGLTLIGQQVDQISLEARASFPKATLDLIESISAKEFLSLATARVDLAAIVLTAASTTKSTTLMNSISTAQFESISKEAQNIFDGDIVLRASEIHEAIIDSRSRQTKRNAFLEKSAELLTNASPEKELILYRMLAKAGCMNLIKQSALKELPSSMVCMLPDELIQKVLTRMNPIDRAELIASQPEDRAQFLLKSLGYQGEKLRDLGDAEVDDIKLDAEYYCELQGKADSLWASFVGTLRSFQKNNPAVSVAIRPIIHKWIEANELVAGVE